MRGLSPETKESVVCVGKFKSYIILFNTIYPRPSCTKKIIFA